MTVKAGTPLISVIIPSYNYAAYLADAVESCLKQTYRKIEIVVIDDGSTDNTQEVAAGYKDRINYIYQRNSGVSSARNKGLEAAKGEYIAFLDADDYLTDDAIESRFDTFLRDDSIGAVVTETYSKKGDKLSCQPKYAHDMVSEMFYEDLLLGRFPFATCATLVKGAIARQFRFPVNLSNGEDVAYFTKIFFSTKVQYLQKPTAVTRWHGDSLRHDTKELKRQGISLVDVIIDDPFYKGALEYLRKGFASNRCLEIFRKLYLFDDKKAARQYYLKAISTNPAKIFKIDYLIKFIKTFL